MTKSITQQAVDLASSYLESEGIYESNDILYRNAASWTSNLSISCPTTLAALIMIGQYIPDFGAADARAIEEVFFS